jgi:hypothetical protein
MKGDVAIIGISWGSEEEGEFWGKLKDCMNIMGRKEQGKPGALIISLEESQASSALPLWTTTDLGQGNT